LVKGSPTLKEKRAFTMSGKKTGKKKKANGSTGGQKDAEGPFETPKTRGGEGSLPSIKNA